MKYTIEDFDFPWFLSASVILRMRARLSSRQITEAVGGDKISRASVINSLEDMVGYGLLDKSEVTGKGGHRGIYSPKFDEAGTSSI